jgi:hypothetical protein
LVGAANFTAAACLFKSCGGFWSQLELYRHHTLNRLGLYNSRGSFSNRSLSRVIEQTTAPHGSKKASFITAGPWDAASIPKKQETPHPKDIVAILNHFVLAWADDMVLFSKTAATVASIAGADSLSQLKKEPMEIASIPLYERAAHISACLAKLGSDFLRQFHNEQAIPGWGVEHAARCPLCQLNARKHVKSIQLVATQADRVSKRQLRSNASLAESCLRRNTKYSALTEQNTGGRWPDLLLQRIKASVSVKVHPAAPSPNLGKAGTSATFVRLSQEIVGHRSLHLSALGDKEQSEAWRTFAAGRISPLAHKQDIIPSKPLQLPKATMKAPQRIALSLRNTHTRPLLVRPTCSDPFVELHYLASRVPCGLRFKLQVKLQHIFKGVFRVTVQLHCSDSSGQFVQNLAVPLVFVNH